MTSPIVFCGCEAFVCEVLGKSTVRAWLRDPEGVSFDKTKVVELDLSANPSDRPGAVEVDNHVTAPMMAGLTTLGPDWPKPMQERGGVWLTKAKFDALPTGTTNFPVGSYPYQWQMLLYLPQGTAPESRYNGFRVELHSQSSGESIFRVWNALDLLSVTSNKLISVDPGNPEHVDAAASDVFTTVGQKGKLFVNWNKLSEYSGLILSPKLPLGEMGGFSFRSLSPSKGT